MISRVSSVGLAQHALGEFWRVRIEHAGADADPNPLAHRALSAQLLAGPCGIARDRLADGNQRDAFFDFKPLRRVIDYLLNISEKSVTLPTMILEQLKALGNDTRMQMMEWLKDPLSNFPPQDHGDPTIGVCVTHLQHKAGLSPSTASAHLAILQRAGFVLTTRIGKWTYYRRNEQAIDDFAARLIIEL